MPSERYLRWHASPQDEGGQVFPDMDEFDVEEDYDDKEGEGGNVGGRVMMVAMPSSSRGGLKRRQWGGIRGTSFGGGGGGVLTKPVLLLVLCCVLCIVMGIMMGYSMARIPATHDDSNHSAVSEASPPSAGVAPGSPDSIDGVAGPNTRDFTRQSAVRLESFLTNDVLEFYVRSLSRIPSGQVPSFVQTAFAQLGLATSSVPYTVMVSTPDGRDPNSVHFNYTRGTSEVINEPKLSDGSLPYAAYSPSGTVEGAVVYAHTGTTQDLTTLKQLGVELEGNIVLLRHTTDSEGLQVKRVYDAGATAVLFYPAPEDFRGNGTAYPNGTGLPQDGVLFPNLKIIPGDPSTMYYASQGPVYRNPVEENMDSTSEYLPRIPVQPISFKTAQQILRALGGVPAPTAWVKGSLGEKQDLQRLGGEWSSASGVQSLRVKVNNFIQKKNVTNVHAWLPCDDPSKVVHIGAAQGNSGGSALGLAALLSIGQSLVRAYPLGSGRRVMLSAWAESNMGSIGATEFTELQTPWLQRTALAYLNIGPTVGIKGGLRVRASPLLHEVVREASHQVAWPKVEAMSVLEGWRKAKGQEYDIAFEDLGCTGDALSFSATLGVPAVEVSVAHPVAPSQCQEGHCPACYDTRSEHPLSHSQYDTTTAATTLLDPGLDWTTGMATLVGVIAEVLSETPVPPVNFKGDFSRSLVDGYWNFLHFCLPALNQTNYDFTEVLDAIRQELYVVQEEMQNITTWYSNKLLDQNPSSYKAFRSVEDRLSFFMQLSRSLIGPLGVGRSFPSALAGSPSIVQTSYNMSHGGAVKANMSLLQVPHHILAIQTDQFFSLSQFNTLDFSRYYNEQNKPWPHTWFPHVSHALARAFSQRGSFEELHKELSLLLGSLKSINTLISLNR